jgi:hypothetical protein
LLLVLAARVRQWTAEKQRAAAPTAFGDDVDERRERFRQRATDLDLVALLPHGRPP